MTEEIKARIESIRKGEVPNGYSKGVAGILPNDWTSKPLSEISEVISKQAGDDDYETLSISAGIGFVNQAQKFGKELSGKQYEKYTVIRKGDFAYNKGNSKRYPQGCTYRLKERDEAAVPNVFECFRIAEGCPEYYEQLFISGFMNRQLTRKINHGVRDDGLLNLTDADFYSTVLPVPSLVEQQKISEILSACDHVIELKQQLLNEKRKQKQWLMQMLLNPDNGVRLPGFEGSQWNRKSIGELAYIYSGGTPDTENDTYWNGEIPWCIPSDITSAGKYISCTENTISELGLQKSSAVILPVGSILMCSRATIGPRSIAKVPIATNQGFKSFVCKSVCNNEFLYYAIDIVLPELLKKAAGNTFKEISKADVAKTIISVPCLQEQEAISECLMCADMELDFLKQEFDAWQQKKKALMQLLLTGMARV